MVLRDLLNRWKKKNGERFFVWGMCEKKYARIMTFNKPPRCDCCSYRLATFVLDAYCAKEPEQFLEST